MQWSDEGIVLGVRHHGESSAVVQLLTLQNGRHAGLVRGMKKAAATCQPGNSVQVTWTGRLPEQLGAFSLELIRPTASLLLDERMKLGALSSACALLFSTLPEREPAPELYLRLRAFAADLEHDPAWAAHYLALELDLLARLGYGLELSQCAATGSTEELIYVSPRSGQAVSAGSGLPYHDRLLKLPAFLQVLAEGNRVAEPPEIAEIIDGFRLTGYFFDKHVFTQHRARMPAARGRLIEQFQGLYA